MSNAYQSRNSDEYLPILPFQRMLSNHACSTNDSSICWDISLQSFIALHFGFSIRTGCNMVLMGITKQCSFKRCKDNSRMPYIHNLWTTIAWKKLTEMAMWPLWVLWDELVFHFSSEGNYFCKNQVESAKALIQSVVFNLVSMAHKSPYSLFVADCIP